MPPLRNRATTYDGVTITTDAIRGTSGIVNNWTMSGSATIDSRTSMETMQRLMDAMDAISAPLGAVPDQENITPDQVFFYDIQAKISGGVGVAYSDMKKYLLILKKKSHMGRSERRMLHNPSDADGKTTASLCVDDLVNI